MKSNANRRAELTAELTSLHEDQIESLREATFTGWTPEQKVEHEKRKDRIAERVSKFGVRRNAHL